MPSAGRTSVRKGSNVIVHMQNGRTIWGKLIETRGRYLYLEYVGRIPMAEIDTICVVKGRAK